MSEYIGSRISLISKSDIRYVGSLHQINSEQSTVSLENVRSYGTEGRKSRLEDEIAPSDQVYEYIIFRGSDVKDLRIEQQPAKENKSSSVPSDPAILGARPRPDAAPQGPVPQGPGPQGPAPRGPAHQGHVPEGHNAQAPVPAAPGFQQPGPASAAHGFNQPGPPQPPFNNHFYGPPPPGSWGRGGGPGPGPGPGPAFGGMPYPPHPGWYPPQGFPPGPGGPGPWNPNFPYPPNLAHAPMQPNQGQNQNARATPAGTPGADAKQDPSAATSVPKQAAPTPSTQPPTEPKSLGQGGPKPQVANDSNPKPAKPTNDRNAPQPTSQKNVSPGAESPPPAGRPKNTRVAPIVPAVPKPFPVPISISAAAAIANKDSPGAAIQDATEAAKAAVALAMAKMETGNNAGHVQPAPSMDNLTKRVDEMRVNAVRAGQSGQSGPAGRGRERGRGGRGVAPKAEVPSADFDFAESNAKFNKEDLLKPAVSASPAVGDDASGSEVAEVESSEQPDDPQAYDKTRSFFDNISSEAKDRAGSGAQKPGGREWRGEEQKKNMETFGQGSVDGGYRNYRGRGRGRGGSRGRGYQNRGGAGQRGRGQGAPPMSAVDQ